MRCRLSITDSEEAFPILDSVPFSSIAVSSWDKEYLVQLEMEVEETGRDIQRAGV